MELCALHVLAQADQKIGFDRIIIHPYGRLLSIGEGIGRFNNSFQSRF